MLHVCVNDSMNSFRILDGSDFDIEAITIRLNLGNNIIVITSIYRPPSANVTYFQNMISFIDKVLSFGFDSVFLGDFTLDFIDQGIGFAKVTETCNIFYLQQLIDKPTHSTIDTASCIDLCFSIVPEKHIFTDVISLNLSDHFLIFTVLDFKVLKNPSYEVKRRSYNSFSRDAFLLDIASSILVNFDPQFYADVEEAWNHWFSVFIGICNKHAPIRHLRVKSDSCPWIRQDATYSSLLLGVTSHPILIRKFFLRSILIGLMFHLLLLMLWMTLF